MINKILRWLGHRLAHILNQPRSYYKKFTTTDEASLKNILQPGDILLVEGDTRFSVIIKYLTQSTWSHVCLYTGPIFDNKELVMIEVDIIEGVMSDEEILCVRHHSHFTPRDFDLSPYFEIVKPTIEKKFSYKKLKWNGDESVCTDIHQIRHFIFDKFTASYVKARKISFFNAAF